MSMYSSRVKFGLSLFRLKEKKREDMQSSAHFFISTPTLCPFSFFLLLFLFKESLFSLVVRSLSFSLSTHLIWKN